MTHGPPTTRSSKAWLVVVTALGAALASALLVGGARSATNISGLIAFTRSDGIYVMRTDGSGVRPLRRGGVTVGAFDLAWSPDGSKLAFVKPYVADAPHGIWVMDANGANLRQLAAVAKRRRYGSPTWLPDGQRIAFTALTDPEPNKGWPSSDIWVVNLDGTHERRLAPYGWAKEVDWSPAGRRIAVISLTGYHSRLYVTNTNGSNRHVLNPGWRYEAAAPDWSPNGRSIAFVRYRSLLSSEIWVADRNGASRVRLTKNEMPDLYPTWSPDGRKIAFVRGGVVRASDEIYVMNADGTEPTRLTHNRVREGYPAWQPVSPS